MFEWLLRYILHIEEWKRKQLDQILNREVEQDSPSGFTVDPTKAFLMYYVKRVSISSLIKLLVSADFFKLKMLVKGC